LEEEREKEEEEEKKRISNLKTEKARESFLWICQSTSSFTIITAKGLN